MWETLGVIDKHRPRMRKTYFFQSKYPKCFEQYMTWFKLNEHRVILLTTLETNRDEGYEKISRAPKPSIRYKQFYELAYHRKVATIEPVLDFDLEIFLQMMYDLHDQGHLEYVWFGFDSKNCGLPEPSIEKAQKFVDALKRYGIIVKGKTLRGVRL